MFHMLTVQKIVAWLVACTCAMLGMLHLTEGDTFDPETFPQVAAEAQAEGTLRVMSFNVRYGDVNETPAIFRRGLVFEQIMEVLPDSLGVQEATPQWMAYLRLLPGYRCVGVGREGGNKGEYNAVFYRADKFKLVDSGTFWLSDTPDEVSCGFGAACNRICTWALLEERESGRQYAHVNTHYDYLGDAVVKPESRMVADFISTRFAGVPVVFTADMNTDPDSLPYRVMTEKLIDTRLASPDSFSFGTFHDGAPAARQSTILDYIFCSPDFTPAVYRTVTAGVNGRMVSDHFPIYADLVPIGA